MSRRAGALLSTFVVAALGCKASVAPALPQWRVVVSTDAPVPQLGDRLLVEVYALNGDVCEGCRREFGVASAAEWPLSFGILPQAGVARVRVRLYRTQLSGPEGPKGDRLLDAIVGLPAAQGVTDVTVLLPMACFGVLADVAGDRSCDPGTGELAPLRAGSAGAPLAIASWPPAKTVPCDGDAPPGMVCVPGGAFLLGDTSFVPVEGFNPIPEQLVQVAPFFLDVDEMKVSDMRALEAKIGAPLPKGSSKADMCTYTPSAGDGEQMPANCVSFALAKAACEALGKRLPTEAEWEWAAGNLGAETRYPWVDSAAPCDDAIVAMGRLADPWMQGEQAACLGTGSPGPRAGGSEADSTELGLENLAGNVSEWVQDSYVDYGDPACWGPSPALHVDPLCDAAAPFHSLRGGSWLSYAFDAAVSARNAAPATLMNAGVGLRCAK